MVKARRMGSKTAPRERILAAAMDLYYDRGYTSVSVDDVLARAKSHKKSFYHYFPSRENLGTAYVAEQSRRYLGFIETLTLRHNTFEGFWKAWMRFLRQDAKRPQYRGCPFALFASQTPDERTAAQPVLDSFTRRWEGILCEFLERVTLDGRTIPRSHTERIVKGLMMHYEGAVVMFVMTHKEVYFQRLELDGLALARALTEEKKPQMEPDGRGKCDL